ncbi:MAG TPA: thioredoxin domain-containing protein [Gemmatimonadales bacterium]|nr:thioredoxin domain-containing protein [Gemmatimonadales bacterium]
MIGLVRHSTRWLALAALILLGIGVSAWFVWRSPVAAEPTPVLPAAEQDPLIAQRTKGKPDAPITVYEMSDFQCPWCRKQALEVLPALDKEFISTGKVKWVFLNLPITSLHPNAAAAAEFAMCAAKADKFWPVHDLLFQYQAKWAPLKDPGAFLMSLADSAGLSRDAVTPCLQSGEMKAIVQAEAEGAAKSGVSSTPTAYIQDAGIVPGAQPLELYRSVLDSLWRDKTKAE